MNIKELKEIIEIFENSRITELDLERQGVRISLKKGPEGEARVIKAEEIENLKQNPDESGSEYGLSEINDNMIEIKTPMVGTFYKAPAPDAEPFVEEGDEVREGDIICIIEAMKLMNEIKSEINGRIVKVLVENGQAVEFNQPLFVIEAL
jgi:acetyl-CoA carboxylase biotin carboxyl carrier protein